MTNFQERARKKNMVYSWPVIAGLILLAVFMGRAAANSYLEFRNVKNAYEGVTREKEEVSRQKDELASRLEYLSRPYGLERELKRQFGLVSPGEKLAVVVERPDKEAGTGETAERNLFYKTADFIKSFFFND